MEEFVTDNQFGIDPEIMADLIKYEKKEKRKQKLGRS
jgi:hypothetical protein